MMKFLMTTAAALMVAGGAQALSVDESSLAGGDFTGNGAQNTDNTLGTLDLGFNDVSGSLDATCDGGFCFGGTDPQDDFFFSVAAGTEIVGLSANIEGGGASDLLFGIFLATRNGGNETNLIFDVAGDLPVNTSVTYLPPLAPVGEGNYFFSIFGVSASSDDDISGFYNVNFEVAALNTPPGPTVPAVPLPATLPLLLAGMGALGIARRKRG